MSRYHDGFTEGYAKGVEHTLVELRAAVDALRPFAIGYLEAKQPSIREFGDAFNFVTAYDRNTRR